MASDDFEDVLLKKLKTKRRIFFLATGVFSLLCVLATLHLVASPDSSRSSKINRDYAPMELLFYVISGGICLLRGMSTHRQLKTYQAISSPNVTERQ